MTFFHFINCFALAYIPYVMLYRIAGLSEYSAFWKCVQAAVAYVGTQMIKMLFLATFFPPMDLIPGGLDIFGEFLRATVDLVDLFGLHLLMSRMAGKGALKYMSAGMGWGSAELVTSLFFPFWFGARGVEFDWKFIQMSLDANVGMAQHLAVAAMVWMYTRNDLNRTKSSILSCLLALACYKSVIILIISQAFDITSWFLVCFKAIFTGGIGIATLQLLLTLSQGDAVLF